jgi:ketosteroid isomerase-like protein
MDETQQFLAEMMPRYAKAENALHNGDVAPRMAMWTRDDPVVLFGAAMTGRGWGEIAPMFESLGAQFSACTQYENEIIAAEASGDLAYTIALEHIAVSVDAVPQRFVLRVTTLFRREDGEWKIVHRHGDALEPRFGEIASASNALA